MSSDHTDVLRRLDPAWAACAEHLAAVAGLVRVHEDLERRREHMERGDTLAILQALAQCCALNLPAPAWLAQAFCSRLNAFTGCEIGPSTRDSLDALFRSPHLRAGQPKRTAKDRADWELGWRLWAQVRRIARDHRSLDSALTAVLQGGAWPVRKRRARELVERADATQVHLTSGRIRPLARLWAKSCKQVRPACVECEIAPANAAIADT